MLFRTPNSSLAFVLFALPAFLGLAGCSKKLTKEEGCQEKWDKVSPKFAKGKYIQSKDLLTEIVTSCPGSPFTEEAMFDLGEAHYHLEEWEEAESEFNSFLREFPNSKKFSERARYRIAEVTAKQVDGPARDQTKTLEAITAWENYLGEYPDGPRADSAQGAIDKLKSILAEKQMMIARLYSRMDEPQAAAVYYKEVLKEYGGRVNEREVNLKLAECYVRMGQFDEAEAYLAKFDGIAKDDPFRKKVRNAYKDLEKARTKLAREKKEEQEQGKRQEAM
jgi:outer membrane protein assembly factor BamD